MKYGVMPYPLSGRFQSWFVPGSLQEDLGVKGLVLSVDVDYSQEGHT